MRSSTLAYIVATAACRWAAVAMRKYSSPIGAAAYLLSCPSICRAPCSWACRSASRNVGISLVRRGSVASASGGLGGGPRSRVASAVGVGASVSPPSLRPGGAWGAGEGGGDGGACGLDSRRLLGGGRQFVGSAAGPAPVGEVNCRRCHGEEEQAEQHRGYRQWRALRCSVRRAQPAGHRVRRECACDDGRCLLYQGLHPWWLVPRATAAARGGARSPEARAGRRVACSCPQPSVVVPELRGRAPEGVQVHVGPVVVGCASGPPNAPLRVLAAVLVVLAHAVELASDGVSGGRAGGEGEGGEVLRRVRRCALLELVLGPPQQCPCDDPYVPPCSHAALDGGGRRAGALLVHRAAGVRRLRWRRVARSPRPVGLGSVGGGVARRRRLEGQHAGLGLRVGDGRGDRLRVRRGLVVVGIGRAAECILHPRRVCGPGRLFRGVAQL
eukprot:scaffold51784_cov33-Phaeocystis_antarctica.AAC.2